MWLLEHLKLYMLALYFYLDSTASQTLACIRITWRAYENTIARPLPRIADLSGVKPEKVNF